jgi:N-acetylglutamate synthase-like GNAT family acetyltransferase
MAYQNAKGRITRTTMIIREATEADRATVVELIETAGLSARGVLTPGSRYWLAEVEGEAIGTVGLELGDGAALLRSAAVLPAWRGRSIGTLLREQASTSVVADGVKQIYLFSTDAGPYWIKQGFVEVPVPELVAALPNSFQVRHYDEIGWLPTEIAYRKDLV